MHNSKFSTECRTLSTKWMIACPRTKRHSQKSLNSSTSTLAIDPHSRGALLLLSKGCETDPHRISRDRSASVAGRLHSWSIPHVRFGTSFHPGNIPGPKSVTPGVLTPELEKTLTAHGGTGTLARTRSRDQSFPAWATTITGSGYAA